MPKKKQTKEFVNDCLNDRESHNINKQGDYEIYNDYE